MAIYRDTAYPGRWASRNTNYPQGAFKNKSGPTATDGSYAEQNWLNDWDGFFGRLLTVAGITPNGIVDNATSSQYYDALSTIVNSLVPSGTIAIFAMQTAPTGWYPCEGKALSRTGQAKLFAAIGTTWGSGDGSTTFNVPDFRGLFLRGYDNGRGIDSNRAFASIQQDAIKSHGHAIRTTTSFTSSSDSGDPVRGGITGSNNTSGQAGSGKTIGLTGDTETRPKNASVMYCIKL